MTEREEELKQQLIKTQELFYKCMAMNIELSARLMLADSKLLDIDLENEQPELYKNLISSIGGSYGEIQE